MEDYADNLGMRDYVPEATAAGFHRDDTEIRGIMGPVGSGKTTACCMEVFSRILEMPPCRDGVRRSRWAFIRNSYPELISTTMKTWGEWVPEELCHISMSPPINGVVRCRLKDGTSVEGEVLFLAIDRPEDTRKLRSLELTGAFLNEASELDEEVKRMAFQRCARYPGVADGVGGNFWTGLVMDTNPPDDTHWWYRLAEVEKPLGHRFWRQPPAIVPIESGEGVGRCIEWVPNDGRFLGFSAAENVKWHKLGYDYWLRQVHGNDKEWCRVFLMGEYGSIQRGKPVYPEYSDAMHYSGVELVLMRGVPLLMGFDLGLTPACVFVQQTPMGGVNVIDEVVTEDMDLRRLLEGIVMPKMKGEYYGCRMFAVWDPSGINRSQLDGRTCADIFNEFGIPSVQAPTNGFLARRDAVGYYLTRLVGGHGALRLSSKVSFLRKGMSGNYRYRQIGSGAHGKRYNEIPEKNIYSHVCEALQYALLHMKAYGGGAPDIHGVLGGCGLSSAKDVTFGGGAFCT